MGLGGSQEAWFFSGAHGAAAVIFADNLGKGNHNKVIGGNDIAGVWAVLTVCGGDCTI